MAPTVPRLEGTQIKPQAGPDVRQAIRTDAPIQAFGGRGRYDESVAAATEDFGRTIRSIADRERRIADNVELSRVNADMADEEIRIISSAQEMRGQDAAGLSEKSIAQYEESAKRVRGTLHTQDQQVAFDNDHLRNRAGLLGRLVDMEDRRVFEYQVKAHENALSSDVKKAIALQSPAAVHSTLERWSNPDRQTGEKDGPLYGLANLHGWGADEFELMKSKLAFSMHDGVVDGMLVAGKYAEAKSYIDGIIADPKRQQEIPGDKRPEILEKINKAYKAYEADAAAIDAHQQGMSRVDFFKKTHDEMDPVQANIARNKYDEILQANKKDEYDSATKLFDAMQKDAAKKKKPTALSTLTTSEAIKVSQQPGGTLALAMARKEQDHYESQQRARASAGRAATSFKWRKEEREKEEHDAPYITAALDMDTEHFAAMDKAEVFEKLGSKVETEGALRTIYSLHNKAVSAMKAKAGAKPVQPMTPAKEFKAEMAQVTAYTSMLAEDKEGFNNVAGMLASEHNIAYDQEREKLKRDLTSEENRALSRRIIAEDVKRRAEKEAWGDVDIDDIQEVDAFRIGIVKDHYGEGFDDLSEKDKINLYNLYVGGDEKAYEEAVSELRGDIK